MIIDRLVWHITYTNMFPQIHSQFPPKNSLTFPRIFPEIKVTYINWYCTQNEKKSYSPKRFLTLLQFLQNFAVFQEISFKVEALTVCILCLCILQVCFTKCTATRVKSVSERDEYLPYLILQILSSVMNNHFRPLCKPKLQVVSLYLQYFSEMTVNCCLSYYHAWVLCSINMSIFPSFTWGKKKRN